MDRYLIKGWILGMGVKSWFSAAGNVLQSIGFGECKETDPGTNKEGEGQMEGREGQMEEGGSDGGKGGSDGGKGGSDGGKGGSDGGRRVRWREGRGLRGVQAAVS